MEKSGIYLKAIREEKGYSIAEVSKATKISPAVLRALEEGRLEKIDQVYLKGFLKMYCRFLRITWEEFLKEYPLGAHQDTHVPKPPPAAQEKKTQPKNAAEKIFSLRSFVVKNKKIIVTILSAVAVLLFLMVSFRGCMYIIKKLPRAQPQSLQKSKKKPTPLAHKPQNPAKSPQVKEVPSIKPLKLYPENTQGANAKIAAPQVKESKPRDITLVIRAREDSFLRIKIDGQSVYQGTLRKGKAESWTAKEKIELSVGNAGGIELEANGKVFSPLGRRGQPLKNILINSEGLKIL